MRRPAAARVAGAVLAAVTAVALALTGVASAASLQIMAQEGSTVFVQTDARCTDATLEVAPSGSSSGGSVGALTISGDLGSCAGGDILVLDAEGTILFSAPVTVAGGVGSAEGLAFPEHQVSGVVLRLDGWLVPATWDYTAPVDPGPVYPGNPDTVLIDIAWTLVTNNPVQACFEATVSTPSTTPVNWQLELDLAKAPFNGTTSSFQPFDVAGQNIAWMLNLTYDHGAKKAWVRGTQSVATVVAGQQVRFSLCNYSLPPGAQTPSAYTVEVQQTTWTNAQACYQVTVRGNGTSIFYFGFTFELDMTPARQRVTSFQSWSNPGGNLWQLTRTDLGGNRFRFVSKTAANIAGTQTYVFSYCAN